MLTCGRPFFYEGLRFLTTYTCCVYSSFLEQKKEWKSYQVVDVEENYFDRDWLQLGLLARGSMVIHSFPAWRSALKRVSVEIGRQVHLLCSWARHLIGLPRLIVTGGNLTQRPKRSLRCLLVEVPWQINEQIPSLVFYPGKKYLERDSRRRLFCLTIEFAIFTKLKGAEINKSKHFYGSKIAKASRTYIYWRFFGRSSVVSIVMLWKSYQ